MLINKVNQIINKLIFYLRDVKMVKNKKLFSSNNKHLRNIKSKIIPYSLSLFSIIFIGYIMINVVSLYYSKYIL